MEQIFDVAKYFLSKESMTHKKLQKLCYYAQAWYEANYGVSLVPDHFEAWVHGPVAPNLYFQYRDWGWLPIPKVENDIPSFSNPNIKNFLDKVYATYGKYTGDQLESITHQEDPWLNARKGYSPSDYCRNTISEDEMKNYYKKRLTRSNGS